MKKFLVVLGITLPVLLVATSFLRPIHHYFTKEKTVTPQVDVSTMDVIFITANSASCKYAFGGSGVAQHGVCVNLTGSPLVNSKLSFPGSVRETLGTKKICSASLKSLSPKTKYYVRAYVKTTTGAVIYGNEKSFTTLPAK